jgi:hypothetical protein
MNIRSKLTLLFCTISVALSGCIESNPLPEPPANEHVYGGKANEAAGDILPLHDGTFLLVGGSQHAEEGDYDLYVVKIDAAGEELSSTKLGVRTLDEMGWKAVACANGDIAVLGTSRSNNVGPTTILFTLLDADLRLKWQKQHLTTVTNAGLWLQGAAFYQLPGGGFIAGYATSDFPVVMRYDQNGEVMNEDIYSEFNGDRLAHLFCRAADSSFVLFTTPQNYYSVENGISALLFDKYGSYQGNHGIYLNLFLPQVIAATAGQGGNFVVSLNVGGGEGGHALSIISSDLSTWTNVERGGPAYYCDVVETGSGKLLFTGYDQYYYENGPNGKFRYVLTNAAGTEIRSGLFGGASAERLRETIVASDGRAVMLGETQSYGSGGTDLYLVFFNE